MHNNVLQDYILVGLSENVSDYKNMIGQKPGRKEFLELANLDNVDEIYSKLNRIMPTVDAIQDVMAIDPIEMPLDKRSKNNLRLKSKRKIVALQDDLAVANKKLTVAEDKGE